MMSGPVRQFVAWIAKGFLLGGMTGYAFLWARPLLDDWLGALRQEAEAFRKLLLLPLNNELLLLVLLLGAAVFVWSPVVTLGKRVLLTWQSGMPVGLASSWFVCSSTFFLLLGSRLEAYSLLPLLVGGGLTVFAWKAFSRRLVSFEDPDLPIRDWANDKLGRRHIVNSLVQGITSSRAAVVALVGPFGDGKSSVLNLLESELTGNPAVLVTRFNPWLCGNADTLVAALFNTIARALNKRFWMPSIQAKLSRYAVALSGLVPRIGGSFRELFKEPSQAEQFEKLRNTIEKLPVRIVVLVDDTDRMQRDELLVLLRMIRGATEFSNLTYVCALHKSALKVALFGEQRDDAGAQEYLERFFPVQVVLPKIAEDVLGKQFDDRLKVLCEKHKLLLEPEEEKEFEETMRSLWKSHLAGHFSNFRKLNLFFNKLEAIIDPVAIEVNLLDLMLLEVVRDVSPNVYDQIYRNGRHFYYPRWGGWGIGGLEEAFLDDEKQIGPRKKVFEMAFANLGDKRELVVSLLKVLFPRVTEAMEGGGIAMGRPEERRSERLRKAHHPAFFPRYFIAGVPSNQFGLGEIDRLVHELESLRTLDAKVDAFVAKFRSLEPFSPRRWNFLDSLEGMLKTADVDTVRAVAFGVAGVASEIGESILGMGESDVGLRIIFTAFSHTPREQKQAFLEEVLRRSTSFAFSNELLHYSRPEKNNLVTDWGNVDLKRLESLFLQLMSEKYKPGLGSEVDLFAIPGGQAWPPFFRWAASGPQAKQQIEEFLTDAFERDPQNLARFLGWFFAVSFQDASNLDGMRKIFPSERVEEMITRLGDRLLVDQSAESAITRFRELMRAEQDRPRNLEGLAEDPTAQ